MIDRIKKIIEKEGNNPSTFADFIGISRSSMNHILNGRNNPSLDVLTKILSNFDNLNSDWLLFGRLPMYKGEKAFLQPTLFDKNPIESYKEKEEPIQRKEMELKQASIEPKLTSHEPITNQNSAAKNITHLIIFYSDGTFETLKA